MLDLKTILPTLRSLRPPRLCVMLFAIFSLAISAFSQNTADEIETLLNTDAVTWAQAARFILEAADVTVTAETNWLPKKASANDTARLDGVALLVMRSFDIKGGIFYSITKNPHYAYRELAYRNIIHGRADPAMTVSGDTLLYIINRVFYQLEEAANQP